ncbi:MAG: hypothetical protein JWR52_3004 [Marmoricola sp.]|nr:hypothetical protein [Marmoricola sp.]
MRKSSTRLASLAAIVVAFCGPAALAPTAFASSSSGATHVQGHCDPSSNVCGSNPVLQGPPPPFVNIPANCPGFISTDTWTLAFTGGHSVFHDTNNSNGDWGGFTADGQATLTTSDNTVQYAGHLTEWGGGGNNSASQNEFGFTLTYHGSGIAGNISIHVTGHSTTNNGGTQTNNFQTATVTCS